MNVRSLTQGLPDGIPSVERKFAWSRTKFRLHAYNLWRSRHCCWAHGDLHVRKDSETLEIRWIEKSVETRFRSKNWIKKLDQKFFSRKVSLTQCYDNLFPWILILVTSLVFLNLSLHALPQLLEHVTSLRLGGHWPNCLALLLTRRSTIEAQM